MSLLAEILVEEWLNRKAFSLYAAYSGWAGVTSPRLWRTHSSCKERD